MAKKTKGVTGKAPAGKKKAAQGNRPYLNPTESKVINRRNTQDLRLAKRGGRVLDTALQSYDQPVNFDALPQAPGAIDWDSAPQAVVGQDFEKWRNDQIDQTYNTYLSRHQKDFDREKEDFEQMAANRGWVPGSQVYNSEKSRLEQSQADQKNTALTQAQAVAGTNAQQFFDVGSNARNSYMNEQSNKYNFGNQYRQDAYGNMMQQRGQGLQDYRDIMGAQSGFGAQNNQYSQGAQQADRNNAAAMAQAMAMKPPAYGGFSSPQEQAAFEDTRMRNNWTWQQANTPRQGGNQPNPWAGALGQIGGAVGGAWAGNYFGS